MMNSEVRVTAGVDAERYTDETLLVNLGRRVLTNLFRRFIECEVFHRRTGRRSLSHSQSQPQYIPPNDEAFDIEYRSIEGLYNIDSYTLDLQSLYDSHIEILGGLNRCALWMDQFYDCGTLSLVHTIKPGSFGRAPVPICVTCNIISFGPLWQFDLLKGRMMMYSDVQIAGLLTPHSTVSFNYVTV